MVCGKHHVCGEKTYSRRGFACALWTRPFLHPEKCLRGLLVGLACVRRTLQKFHVPKWSRERLHFGYGLFRFRLAGIHPSVYACMYEYNHIHRGCLQEVWTRAFVFFTRLELQSRFGDTPLKFQVICPQLSPKRGCGPKRVKETKNGGEVVGQYTIYLDPFCFESCAYHCLPSVGR